MASTREIVQKILAERKKNNGKTKMRCMECGLGFLKKIPKSFEVKCRNCGSYDIEVA